MKQKHNICTPFPVFFFSLLYCLFRRKYDIMLLLIAARSLLKYNNEGQENARMAMHLFFYETPVGKIGIAEGRQFPKIGKKRKRICSGKPEHNCRNISAAGEKPLISPSNRKARHSGRRYGKPCGRSLTVKQEPTRRLHVPSAMKKPAGRWAWQTIKIRSPFLFPAIVSSDPMAN